ncbi:MAG: cytidylate kinase-like family protein, partial [Paludibacteraceae bacterium]|nr:cytidylate kinase-like family protein [Paludibacteraceae bacterium]
MNKNEQFVITINRELGSGGRTVGRLLAEKLGVPFYDKTETLILQDLATEKSCVVAGRSGFHVFRDHPNHLSILIQASTAYRVERIMRKQNMTED